MSLFSATPLETAGRHECKYRISPQQYLAMRSAVFRYMRLDRYTARAQTKGYVVRSLYYDTAEYRVYAEKLAGDCARVKYRLRSYSLEDTDSAPVRVEMKVRRGEALAKYQHFVSKDQYARFLSQQDWGEDVDHPVLTEYARGVRLLNLQPVVLVEYEREGFESKMNDGVRLTFDHHVRSARASALFPAPRPFFRVHHIHEVVLEVKFKQTPPIWLKPLVQAYGLRLVANSKFTQGIEVARPDRCHPQGVVVVR